MILVEHRSFKQPVLPAAGKLAYVSHAPMFGPKGQKFWLLFPNGADIDWGEGPRRMIAEGETPEEAWAKVVQNSALLKQFGAEL